MQKKFIYFLKSISDLHAILINKLPCHTQSLTCPRKFALFVSVHLLGGENGLVIGTRFVTAVSAVGVRVFKINVLIIFSFSFSFL